MNSQKTKYTIFDENTEIHKIGDIQYLTNPIIPNGEVWVLSDGKIFKFGVINESTK